MAYLRSLVGSDGAIRYSRTSTQTPVWVTAQAVAALARKALPLKPVPRERKRHGHGGARAGRNSGAPGDARTHGDVTPGPHHGARPARGGRISAWWSPSHATGEPVTADEVVAQLPSPLELALRARPGAAHRPRGRCRRARSPPSSCACGARPRAGV